MTDVVAGQTAALYHYLKIDDDVPKNADGSALSMSGMTVAFIVHDTEGDAVTILGTASIEDADAWLVKFSPNTADFVAGKYRARYKVTDGTGKIAYFPSGDWEPLTVRDA